MDYKSRITIDANVCHGKPCIRGMRWPIEVIIDLIGSGMTNEDILLEHEELESDDIEAVLEYIRFTKKSATPIQSSL